jgi:hypothetical protein
MTSPHPVRLSDPLAGKFSNDIGGTPLERWCAIFSLAGEYLFIGDGQLSTPASATTK